MDRLFPKGRQESKFLEALMTIRTQQDLRKEGREDSSESRMLKKVAVRLRSIGIEGRESKIHGW